MLLIITNVQRRELLYAGALEEMAGVGKRAEEGTESLIAAGWAKPANHNRAKKQNSSLLN